ncbi:MAG TPA: universal stress protein [Acidimicrobiia bacterium]|nr:universal stress protein [Acidimicrobiia bacterium]
MVPKTFVVPLDGSDFATKAADVAAGMARHCGASLKLVASSWNTHHNEDPQPFLEKIADEYADLDVATVVIDDRPAAGAIQSVASEPEHVVCMTTHGRGRFSWAALGSIAESVVRDSTAPVLLVGRHCPATWPTGARRMIVAVDGSTAAPPTLPEAVTWAKAFQLEVDVTTVLHPLDTEGPDKIIDAIVQRVESDGLHAHRRVVYGSYPAGTLADAAISAEADLVVMGTHALAGVSRLALGSLTIGVVGLAPCPVLVTRVD